MRPTRPLRTRLSGQEVPAPAAKTTRMLGFRGRVLVVVAALGALAPLALLPVASADPVGTTLEGALVMHEEPRTREITYVGVLADRLDLRGLGAEGYWFPYFDVAGSADETTTAPTGAGAVDGLPTWVAAFNHTAGPHDPGCTDGDALLRGCQPTYNFRTFSQDGPARAAGGYESWSALRLPTWPEPTCGRAGAIVDPKTWGEQQLPEDFDDVTDPGQPHEPDPTKNNTINRIQLREGTPEEFYVGVVLDATGGRFDAAKLAVRGNVGTLDYTSPVDDYLGAQINPGNVEVVSNGVPDVHMFKVTGFMDGDYLKLRLQGTEAGPASFSGLLFDTDFSLRPSWAPGAGEGEAEGHVEQANREVRACVS